MVNLQTTKNEPTGWKILKQLFNDCNWIRTHNHLVHKRTLNQLAKWLSVRL